MKRHRPWHNFQAGQRYSLVEVVSECDRHIREGGVISPDTKSDKVRHMERHFKPTLEWAPSTEKGWGASPLNPNCWKQLDESTEEPTWKRC
jgi:hypothetical protein